MTMAPDSATRADAAPSEQSALDRQCELANIGAGHAATAFAQLAGRAVRMKPPRVAAIDAPLPADPAAASSGVFFELEGCFDAFVGVIFDDTGRDALVRCMLGADANLKENWFVESALMEVANILVSHIASAIADTLGERLLPSLPQLAAQDAGAEFVRSIEARPQSGPLRIECELFDEIGVMGGLLVLVPDRPATDPSDR
jgi:chemotaxis protein CheC